MIDFLMISTRSTKRGVIEVYPKFVIKKSSDLMIRGGDFYAIWIEERGLWSIDEQDALQLIDSELDRYAEENRSRFDSDLRVLHMWDAESGMIDTWHKYCQKQMRDSFHALDEKLIFSNAKTNKKDYASKRLSYPLEAGSLVSYDRLMSVLYSEDERCKIEWAIGSIVSGESKKLQKFMVLYGAHGTGKSTILNIVQQLFDGYYSTFDARALGSSSNSFALEAFKSSPLVAIQHDGDLSKIEDNTRLNSLVSHELMTVNEKFKSTYSNRFKCFLFMGTNKPVKITDAKSGLIRRLIDVSPTGNTLGAKEYKSLVKQIEFELGAIAYHCQELYLSDPGMYDSYMPLAMLGASNDFYNFVIDSYHVFKNENGTTLKAAWEMYKAYCDDAKVSFPNSQRIFKEELKNYFWDYKERFNLETGERVRSYYSEFRTDKFDAERTCEKEPEQKISSAIKFSKIKSIFDMECASCFAQYATSKETPSKKWDEVKSKLSSLDTSRIHYVRLPENHIVIDFDITDKDGKKSLERNIEEASKWPRTYAELSKSGSGVHLHYIYTGDPTKLSSVYEDHIEVKVPIGNSSLRRKLSQCNDLPIATISSGLPLKGENKMVNFDAINSEKGLRTLIKRNLCKEIHPGTKPSVDFIYKVLEDSYSGGLTYDISDMKNAILAFAASSTNQADYCIRLVSKMQFKSEEPSSSQEVKNPQLIFYDVEVFPNLFICNWKIKGKDKPVVRMINPSPTEVEALMKMRLVGFNCRRYDNHILYARLMGYTNEQLFDLSQKIINGVANSYFGEAYNASYTDVYDFASAGNKKSLKKWEIELGLKHHELGLPWDQPVPEERWIEVAEYCDDDVLATEEVFAHLGGDWTARQILADLAEMTVNDTTNTLTTRIIFGKNRKPQGQFNHRDMSKPVTNLDTASYEFLRHNKVLPLDFIRPEGASILPYFPGYEFEAGKSTYRGEEIGEGGRVYSEPGIYGDVALLDVVSQHPHSAIAEVLFGPEFTARFKELVDGRVAIKHEDWDTVSKILDGKLAKYVQKILDGEMTSKDLSNGLKTPINSAYGLTAASFENPFRDPRNKDNIVAKRGALFMTDLKYEVQKRGFVVAHIKTDSIKIPDATPEIIQFVMNFGKAYGYEFEHEATYDRLCLVNDAVYIAKYASKEKCEQLYGYIPGDNKKHPDEWTATGTQFAVPYVFKKLFTKDDIIFEDMCETKSVTTVLHLDMNEGFPDVSVFEKTKLVRADSSKASNKDLNTANAWSHLSEEELDTRIGEGHNYRFVGKVGSFCPIKPGCGGGLLMREKDGKFYAATGSKGFRWLEAEMVRELDKAEIIDRSYYDGMVDDAMKSIASYGDLEWFVSDDPYTPNPNAGKYCDRAGGYLNCPHYDPDNATSDCKLGYDCLPF